ncbi:Zinc finger homeobox protein 4 [Trichinella papuae]|uniref:Zinc finger homeobox protein 4 n=1 Tax=Trichinella papuae TaxID=268474 RepID=A0A0V1N894_9BILA|nr:Zinc finger homeobox protein 4 [Trichinella papuae]
MPTKALIFTESTVLLKNMSSSPSHSGILKQSTSTRNPSQIEKNALTSGIYKCAYCSGSFQNEDTSRKHFFLRHLKDLVDKQRKEESTKGDMPLENAHITSNIAASKKQQLRTVQTNITVQDKPMEKETHLAPQKIISEEPTKYENFSYVSSPGTSGSIVGSQEILKESVFRNDADISMNLPSSKETGITNGLGNMSLPSTDMFAADYWNNQKQQQQPTLIRPEPQQLEIYDALCHFRPASRTRLSEDESNILEEYFEYSVYLKKEDIQRLLTCTALPYDVIRNWFSNTRRKKQVFMKLYVFTQCQPKVITVQFAT